MVIVIFCNNHEQFDFFSRIVRSLNEQGHKVVFLSHRLSLILRAKKRRYRAVLLHGVKKSTSLMSQFDIQESFEVKNGLLSVTDATNLICRVEASFLKFIADVKPDQIWFWDGCNLMRQTIASIAIKRQIKTLFFQLGNFPGKLFVDCKGVNSQADYVNWRKKISPELNVDWQSYLSWKKEYVGSKLRNHTVKQKPSTAKFNWSYMYDLVGFFLFCVPQNEKTRPILKVVNFLKIKFFRIKLDTLKKLNNGDYYLFPLQVNSGSQVLWNSDISQIEAIEKSFSLAQKENIALVVKIHPVEDDFNFLKSLIILRKKLGFLLVDIDMFKLLQGCKKLITLNSTSGIEAILMGKPVDILGNSHYEGMKEVDLAFYIQKFLLDIDCFDSCNISREQIEAILQRSDKYFWKQYRTE